MPVEVGEWSAAAFIALFVAAALILGAAYARRHGRLRGRAPVVIIAAIVALLVVFGMGAPGFLTG